MVEPITVTVDAKGMPLPPVDPNIKLPPSVQRGKDQAEALHKQAYNTPQPDPAQSNLAPQPVQSELNLAPAAPVPAQPSAPAAPAPAQPGPEGDRASWDAAKWMQHAKSMEGRFKQSQEQVQTLQGTVTDLGQELVQTQATVRQPPPIQPPVPQPHVKQVTQQDVDTYGEDFLSVAQRAAFDAVAPKLNQLEQRNQQLEKQLRRQTIMSVEAVLDAQVPSWPQINLSPKFKDYLRKRDIYSGRLRSEMLSEAHRAADAARVLAFFKGFLAEEEATGSTEFLPGHEQPLPAAPHTPAVELQTLAAPGHARPAQGNQPQSANEPIWITRGQISKFYDNVRKGVYVGRDQDYQNDQAIIFECQRAGRIR